MSEFVKPAPLGKQVGNGWPSWRYGPNGEAEIFQREEDVPPGWTDYIPKRVLPPVQEAPAASPVDRKTVVAALIEAGVQFPRNAATSELERLLKVHNDNRLRTGDASST